MITCEHLEFCKFTWHSYNRERGFVPRSLFSILLSGPPNVASLPIFFLLIQFAHGSEVRVHKNVVEIASAPVHLHHTAPPPDNLSKEDGYRKWAGKGIPAAARGSHVFRHLRKRKP